MKHLLSAPQLERLQRLAPGSLLVAFDFDGTLAPIVADRQAAAMRPRTGLLFQHVCLRYPCAVISGRARDDVTARLAFGPVKHVVGDHGIDCEGHVEQAAHFAEYFDQAKARLREALRDCAGIEIEDKPYSLSVHYRAAPDRARARWQIDDAVNRLGLRVRRLPGKLVLNLLPAHAPNKGDALLRLWSAESTEHVLYVGDDITDEDVFRLGHARLISVRIGISPLSAAGYYLANQREVDHLLRHLIAARRASLRP